MSNLYRCCTCGFESANVDALVCGHWRTCPHYAKAATDGTLPSDSERYTGKVDSW